MKHTYDVTIIGGGPTGLFAAYYAGFRGLSVKIVDSQPDLGGQITALYPDKYIYDVAGFPRILGKDLVANLVEQAMQYEPAVVLSEEIRSFEHLADRTIRLVGASGEHHTRAVVITAGIGAFTPKTYQRPEIDRYVGRGLSYAVRRREDFRDRTLLVVGGGDSAVDWALNLAPIARHITLVHRRDGFRAHEDSVKKLLASPITVKLFCELKGLRGEPAVSEAVIVNTRTREEEVVAVDAVLAFLGLVSHLGAIAKWGLVLNEDAIVVDTTMATNLPGVYAAGDVVTYPGKLKLIATGFGEAATAVNNAARYIHPDASLFPGHSSTIMEKQGKERRAVVPRPN
ncbi:MAG: NAD(P)/FAD-dependent oxidoreductase [Armatimonadota bacterium]|nr:NAD(P)/FAD-dependent oxidoreductase [Armatimonadota bacterium]MDR7519634.1 NAD(P)/FAD-dependent oxidoreductase [Armatimonadota bacterium]MDR7549802.1 NAD(P)/FAD-dependent oxidoreductase [Armatimonadota bacterium]